MSARDTTTLVLLFVALVLSTASFWSPVPFVLSVPGLALSAVMAVRAARRTQGGAR